MCVWRSRWKFKLRPDTKSQKHFLELKADQQTHCIHWVIFPLILPQETGLQKLNSSPYHRTSIHKVCKKQC